MNQEKRMKKLMQEPYYQGQMKLQKMQEQAAKDGLHVSTNRRMALKSTGQIADYALPHKFSLLPSPASGKFWAYLWYRFATAFKSRIYYPIKIRNLVNKEKLKVNIKRKEVKDAAANLYLKFNSQRAKNDVKSMEEYLAPEFLSKVVKEISVKKLPPNMHCQWSVGGDLKLKRLSTRLVDCAPYTTDKFLQVVFKITSSQKVTVVNSNGEEVGGTPLTPVTDYFAFEKELVTDAPWYIIGQLHDQTEPFTEVPSQEFLQGRKE